ncbi:MAG: hypothetical protein JNL52_09945 [Flavobacteriales bacterium]|nr:hypothetical protein [Flavobacteriales bacterium]
MAIRTPEPSGEKRPSKSQPASAPPARKRKRIRWGRVGLVGGLLFTVIVGTVRSCLPEEVAPVVAEEPAVERGPILDCTTYPYKHFSKRLRDKLPEYKHLSLGAGVAPVADEKILEKLISQRSVGLVRVTATDAFWVAPMAHGRPYLTPRAHAVLQSISNDFHKRIQNTDVAHARIKVTSLFRTRKDQRELGRSNVNATRDASAPHTHGTSMDLSYMKFVDADGESLELAACQQVFLAETLAEVIDEHRRKDKLIFATREAKQACYHLSVCR